eukprot:4883869-Prymnesium_polylepis.2
MVTNRPTRLSDALRILMGVRAAPSSFSGVETTFCVGTSGSTDICTVSGAIVGSPFLAGDETASTGTELFWTS